ncbi:MAG: type I-B CRISPR-associated protein Cas8b1/Cst1, partial [Anaerolineae bacterium]
MIRFTGHPLVDVGVAVITLFNRRQRPEELTEADLERMADYVTAEYVRQPLKSFLTVAFPNSGFTQPAFEKTPERRLTYANLVARAYRQEQAPGAETCVFTG